MAERGFGRSETKLNGFFHSRPDAVEGSPGHDSDHRTGDNRWFRDGWFSLLVLVETLLDKFERIAVTIGGSHQTKLGRTPAGTRRTLALGPQPRRTPSRIRPESTHQSLHRIPPESETQSFVRGCGHLATWTRANWGRLATKAAS
jgi:hypothetical protein